MKYILMLFVLVGCATTDSKLVTQLLEDIQNQKNANQLMANQCNQAIKECQDAKIKPAVKK